MDENKNSITYDENWQSVSTPEYPAVESNDEEIAQNRQSEKSKQKSDSPKQLLITLQLIACIIIALAAFIIKNIGGELYAVTRNAYYTALNNSAIFSSEQFDLNSIFGLATKDEI